MRATARIAALLVAFALGACAVSAPAPTDDSPGAVAERDGAVPTRPDTGAPDAIDDAIDGAGEDAVGGAASGTADGASGGGIRGRAIATGTDAPTLPAEAVAPARPDPRGPALPPGADADDDRVADPADECPGTPPDTLVDVHGCALFARALDGVEFATGDHRLGAEARRALDRLIADLARHPDVRIRLEGHTDNRGTAVSNLELSKERVMSVARYLVAGGVSPSRLKPYGYGESRPRAGNRTAAGRERNRRIEIGPPELP